MTPEQLDEIEKLAEAQEFLRVGAYALPLVKAVREARQERDEAFRERVDWIHSLDRSKGDIITLMRERDEARAEVERLRDLIDTVIRNCMECYDKRECQSCAWLREGTENKR